MKSFFRSYTLFLEKDKERISLSISYISKVWEIFLKILNDGILIREGSYWQKRLSIINDGSDLIYIYGIKSNIFMGIVDSWYIYQISFSSHDINQKYMSHLACKRRLLISSDIMCNYRWEPRAWIMIGRKIGWSPCGYQMGMQMKTT